MGEGERLLATDTHADGSNWPSCPVKFWRACKFTGARAYKTLRHIQAQGSLRQMVEPSGIFRDFISQKKSHWQSALVACINDDRKQAQTNSDSDSEQTPAMAALDRSSVSMCCSSGWAPSL